MWDKDQLLLQVFISSSLIKKKGLACNLILGALGVYSGTMTPGDLVMVQTLMVQVKFINLHNLKLWKVFQPLHNLGVLSREFVDSYFEIRELFGILEKKPKSEIIFIDI